MNNDKNMPKVNLTGKTPDENVNPAQFLTASSIIGDRVENSKGETLGDIKDVMLDIQNGKIEYVVMEFGGFLGLGEKLFAIPFGALELNPKKQAFIVDWKKETVENAPGFDKDHWPKTKKHYDDVNTYWGDFMGPHVGRV
ncbi:MAG: PRC-barrel domain-containing protein [Cytophagaceae bacterium]